MYGTRTRTRLCTDVCTYGTKCIVCMVYMVGGSRPGRHREREKRDRDERR